MPSFTRSPDREAVYQAVINDLVLGNTTAKAVAAEYDIPLSTVRWWKYHYIKTLGGQINIEDAATTAAGFRKMWSNIHSRNRLSALQEKSSDFTECLRKSESILRESVCEDSLTTKKKVRIPQNIRPSE